MRVVKPFGVPVAALALLLSLAVLLVQCSGGGGGGDVSPPITQQPVVEPEPFAEIFRQGIAQYQGVYSPMLAESDSGHITHTFGAGNGPLCFEGDEYKLSTRDMGSQDLLIFLQGGGACWSDICSCNIDATHDVPHQGILDPESPQNPFKAWNMVFLPYCDGSHFAGDRDFDVDDDDDGAFDHHHYQRGLKNLSAGLDVAANAFPAPRRVVIAGVSAGGFATAYALPLVRRLYPDVRIYVINDSGVGVLPPGIMGKMLSEWNAEKFIPSSCLDCTTQDGHFSNYYRWQLSEDPRLRLGMMSYTRDTVIADGFSDMGGDLFEQVLATEMAGIEEAYPGRMHYFMPSGTFHTFLLGSLQVTAGGMTVAEWIAAMLDDSPEWTSKSD